MDAERIPRVNRSEIPELLRQLASKIEHASSASKSSSVRVVFSLLEAKIIAGILREVAGRKRLPRTLLGDGPQWDRRAILRAVDAELELQPGAKATKKSAFLAIAKRRGRSDKAVAQEYHRAKKLERMYCRRAYEEGTWPNFRYWLLSDEEIDAAVGEYILLGGTRTSSEEGARAFREQLLQKRAAELRTFYEATGWTIPPPRNVTSPPPSDL